MVPTWAIVLDYIMGMIMWTLIGRAFMNIFQREDSTFFFMRVFVKYTNPIIKLFKPITPSFFPVTLVPNKCVGLQPDQFSDLNSLSPSPTLYPSLSPALGPGSSRAASAVPPRGPALVGGIAGVSSCEAEVTADTRSDCGDGSDEFSGTFKKTN